VVICIAVSVAKRFPGVPEESSIARMRVHGKPSRNGIANGRTRMPGGKRRNNTHKE